MNTSEVINPDLAKERQNATVKLDEMKSFLGEMIYLNQENYRSAIKYRDVMVKTIKPISDENFYNLERDQKYQMIFKKSLEMFEFVNENKIESVMSLFNIGSVFGLEKILFNLHFTMFRDALNVWGNPEQSAYWQKYLTENAVFGTYVQTELGHGTYLRGLETTATYDKFTQEFIIDSPTLTSIKFWPGGSGKSCNFAIVMAKLIIDGTDHGIHAFVVQLRSLIDHKVVPGIEIGDIGRKFGFDATDNGYLKFDRLRIPRNSMLMQFAEVSPSGQFTRKGNELLMYATMLLMRGNLPLVGAYYLSISSTIAIRYSCVRRQTADSNGVEPQIINYQTQQIRLFPALASAYATLFSALNLREILLSIQKNSDNFKNISPDDLAKLHALSSGLKSLVFSDCLKFAQSNRLCCGGHGYSASSGLSQIIQEADAACTYEGDNVVLLLQTARYLLKCAQKGISPHLEFNNFNDVKNSNIYKQFSEYLSFFHRLYEELSNEVTGKLFKLVKEDRMAPLDAWNCCSFQLTDIARVYIEIFILNSNLLCVYKNGLIENQRALSDLMELYILYSITDNYSGNFLRMNILKPETLNQFKEKMLDLLPIIRKNAVALVDSFDLLDSNLCSSLGAYDGRAYERLLDFARKSQFNEKEVHEVFHKYLKPFAQRQKLRSKL
ncbi:peroxisomal acyl-coenzyme A oxidase 1 isoform X2 [Brachionus plicatilis]|uniref:Acyl-coenzyme A oxidase n=1 Tax=Brachionus plicatilis TaxID=10195 RepID=A0A3M7SF75_BRAPC|nr:peroxisomal acyl-coenzyme A oxidase 1 isoform X2 [Brachionus plicatilis]